LIMDTLPIIDLGSSGEGDGASLTRIAAAVGAACRHFGFFYVVHHGVEAALIAEAFTQSHRFFSLSLADKQALAIEKIGGNRGYSGFLHEALDPARGPDMKEAFNIGLDLAADDPELRAGKPFRSLNAWPELSGFRKTALAYYNACAALGARLHRAFARDLGLQPDFFTDKFDRPMATLRLLHYPASKAVVASTGAGEHTDYGNLTLLATDDVGGLEVRTRDGQWIGAPVVPGAFIVNIGDCLMRWTNDVYVSTPHRVINRTMRERYSIAFFYDPNPNAMVETIPSCVGKEEVTRYPPILAADYLKMRLAASKTAEVDPAGVWPFRAAAAAFAPVRRRGGEGTAVLALKQIHIVN
jgi:isopenicillin N synthase-like dioxygenase